MIKWFCDVCNLEIWHPENPVKVKAYRCGKSREDATVGWSEDDEILSVFCHAQCADLLERELRNAFIAAQELAVRNKS